MYFVNIISKSLLTGPKENNLDLDTLLFLNESNLKLTFVSSQFQISAQNEQESQNPPGFLVLLASALCDASSWLNEGTSKILQISNEIFYTISWIRLRFMAAHLEISWCRNVRQEMKLFSPFLLQWSTISIYSHCIPSHNMLFRPKAINLKIFIAKTISMPFIPCWHFVPAPENHSYLTGTAYNMYWIRFSSVKWKVLLWLWYFFFVINNITL